MSHDCAARINQHLAPRNTRLASFVMLNDKAPEPFAILTEKLDWGVRGKPIKMFASHCPFCGVKL